jgi:hypothetical protein
MQIISYNKFLYLNQYNIRTAIDMKKHFSGKHKYFSNDANLIYSLAQTAIRTL